MIRTASAYPVALTRPLRSDWTPTLWRRAFLDRRWRARLAGLLVGLGVASLALYVAAVNTILLGGEELQRLEAKLLELEARAASLESEVVARQSPSWLEEQARLAGLVEVAGVRYLEGGGPFVLWR